MMYRSGTLAHVNTLSEVLKLLKERLGGRGTILQMLNCLYGVLSRELEFSIVKTVGHFFLQNLKIYFTCRYFDDDRIFIYFTCVCFDDDQLSVRG